MSDISRLQDVIDKAKHLLSEHFDVGIILVQSQHKDETFRWEETWGNSFAREKHLEIYHNEQLESIDVEVFEEDDENDE